MREYRRKTSAGEPTASKQLTKHAEYGVWMGMIGRCENPKAKAYPDYGGRGIRVCSQWRDSFERFLSDVGARPSPNHSIDRVDNDGHYEPGNCRWATKAEQQNNRRTNRKVTVQGETMNLWQALRRFDVCDATFRQRTQRGWTDEAALLTPPVTGPRARNYYGTCL